MANDIVEDENLRDFYRVTCDVEMQIEPLSDDDIQGTYAAADFFPANNAFNLLRELRRLEFENSHLLHNINESDRDIGAYFSIINKKLELLARQVTELSGGPPHREQSVSLSEGGVAFHSDTVYETGTPVACQITLLPALFGVSVFGRVAHCEQTPEGRHIAVHFENLSDADRQILAKHVIQVQLAEKRRRHNEE